MADRRRCWAAGGEGGAIVVLVVLGAVLRLWRPELGWFGVDQARDVATGLGIADGSLLPHVGPTMRRVLHLGASYYYFWAIPYLVSADPLAGFRFAGILAALAMALTWLVARRVWGPLAGIVTLAVAALQPVWVIDGRVLWSPAALPFAAAVILVLLLAGEMRGRRAGRDPWTPLRASALGAVLGLVVQLHLSMVVWVPTVTALVLADRPSRRSLLGFVVGGLASGAPALIALASREASDGGVASVAVRAAVPSWGGRLVAIWMLPARVLDAFGADVGVLVLAATAVLGACTVVGIVRLAVAALGGDRVGRTIVLVFAAPIVAATVLPGESWYYYLDGVLPVAALAAGAAVAPVASTATVVARLRMGTAVIALVAACVLGESVARWLRAVASHGYMDVAPAGLSLDGVPGRDAATPGRLLTAGVKRAVAEAAASTGADYPTLWQRVHGPAFGDVTGDNGFWLSFATRHATGTPDRRHVGVWYRDDPEAAGLVHGAREDAVDVRAIGPLVLALYQPTIEYAGCRTADGPIAVPIRVRPDPLRYGDGTTALPPALPASCTCPRAVSSHVARVAALLGRVDAGAVSLAAPDAVPEAAGWRTSVCVSAATAAVTVTVAREPGRVSDLDVYDVPFGGCPG